MASAEDMAAIFRRLEAAESAVVQLRRDFDESKTEFQDKISLRLAQERTALEQTQMTTEAVFNAHKEELLNTNNELLVQRKAIQRSHDENIEKIEQTRQMVEKMAHDISTLNLDCRIQVLENTSIGANVNDLINLAQRVQNLEANSGASSSVGTLEKRVQFLEAQARQARKRISST